MVKSQSIKVRARRKVRKAPELLIVPRSNVEPINEAYDYVRDQVTRMYVSRRRLGFWPRALVCIALITVLGILLYLNFARQIVIPSLGL